MTEKAPLGLSPRERQIMDVLYREGEATVSEVIEGMTSPPSYSAVRATLRVLEEKGEVVHREEGRRYVYMPSEATEKARSRALAHVVRTFFDGEAERAAVALLRMSEVELGDDDLARLAERIERARKEGR